MMIQDIPIDDLREAPWNANQMDMEMMARLRESISRFGVVENLVVRSINDATYEVLGGNQRLQVLRDLGWDHAPCVVVEVDDSEARLMAQALNRIEGEDDLGLKAELIRDVLKAIPENQVLSLLPESAGSLAALASLGETDLSQHLEAWEAARAARLQHLVFQVTRAQLEVVQQAMERVKVGATKNGDNPNERGNALYILCLSYLEKEEENSR